MSAHENNRFSQTDDPIAFSGHPACDEMALMMYALGFLRGVERQKKEPEEMGISLADYLGGGDE